MVGILRIGLLITFVGLLVVNAIVLLGAFANHRLALEAIESTMSDVSVALVKASGGENAQADEDVLNSELLRVRNAGGTVLDNSMLMFLFTVFSIFIVSGALYALERSREAREAAVNYGTLGVDANCLMGASASLTMAYQLALSLWSAKEGSEKVHYVPVLRESLRSSARQIRELKAAHVGMSEGHHANLLDMALRTKQILERIVVDDERERLCSMMDDVGEILHILKTTDFVDRFRRKVKLQPPTS